MAAPNMANWPPLTAELNYTIGVLKAYGKFNGVPLTQEQIEYQLSHYYESSQEGLIAGTVVMVVVTGIAVILRLLSRRVKKVSFGADDYMAIAGLFLFYTYVASFCVVLYYGLGHHTFRIGAYKFLHVGKPYYAWECLYGPVTFATKMSVLLLYRRVFVITSRAWQISFWTIVGLFAAWAIANTAKDIFQASPIRAVWSLVPDAKWIDVLPSFFYAGIVNALLTIAVLILPMPLIWKMHMTAEKRVGLCVLFGLGCSDILVIIARSVLTKSEKFPNTDFTWSVMPTTLLAVVEQCIAILCASLPMVRSLFIRVYKSGIRSSQGSSGERQAALQPDHRTRAGSSAVAQTITPPDPTAKSTFTKYNEKQLGLIPLAKIEDVEESPARSLEQEKANPKTRYPPKSWRPLFSRHGT